MPLPIQLISTDFDGTLHAEFEDPPVPCDLQELIGELQRQGAKWAINTGRDLSSVMEGIARARLSIRPDYLIVVEREIYIHQGSHYSECEAWNRNCTRAHEALFARVQPEIPRLVDWITQRFSATLYQDDYSPFCLVAANNEDADAIQAFLEDYLQTMPELAFVRNDVYARFSHSAYNKGTALAEIARQLGIGRDHIFAAGDHLNDLPMLTADYARWLAAPSNAVEAVKKAVREQKGFVSEFSHGDGVADAIKYYVGAEAG